jgi:hypothetical protein
VGLETGGRFGASLLAAHLDGDSCTDLAIGIPDLTVDGVPDAGGVQIMYGGQGNFVTGPLLTRGSNGVPGVPSEGEHFGTSLDSARNGSVHRVGLHIGAPGIDVGSVEDAGGVVELDYELVPGEHLGTPLGSSVLEPGHELAGAPGRHAHLGAVMAGRLVGAPDRTVNGHRGAGLVSTANYQFDTYAPVKGFTALKSFVIRGSQTEEHLGKSLSVSQPLGRYPRQNVGLNGSPGRTVGGERAAGAVTVVVNMRVRHLNVARITQATPGVPGKAHSGRQFGASVARNLNVAAVGVPGAAADGKRQAGAVVAMKLDGTSVVAARLITRSTPGVPSGAHAGDRFGHAVMFRADDYPSNLALWVSVPGADQEDRDAGTVAALYWVSGRLAFDGGRGVNGTGQIQEPDSHWGSVLAA